VPPAGPEVFYDLPANVTQLTTLAQPVGLNDQQIQVNDPAPPALQSGFFRILVDNEWMIAFPTGATQTWPVVRGIEGSAPATHSASAAVQAVATAGALALLQSQINGLVGSDSTIGGPGGAPVSASIARTSSVASLWPATVLIVGASIEQNEGSDWPVNVSPSSPARIPLSARFYDLGIVNWANWFLGGMLQTVRNAAVAGYTSAQLLTQMQDPRAVVAAPDGGKLYALNMNPAPGIIYLGAVTGDDPGTLTAQQSAANDLAIYQMFRAAYPYAIIVLPTMPGVNIPAGVGNSALRALVNPQRRMLAQTNPNTVLFDFEAVYLDPTSATGLPLAAYSQDNVHPNPTGAMVLGQVLANLLAPFIGFAKQMVNDYLEDPRVSVANGGWTNDAMMRGTVGPGNTATNWTFAGPAGATRGLVLRTDQYGNWQEMTYGGTAGQMKLSRGLPSNFPAGAIINIEAEVMFRGSLLPGTITDISLALAAANANFQTIATTGAMGNTVGNQGPYRDPGIGQVLTLKSPPLVVPPGMVGANSPAQFAINGTATSGSIRVGRFSLVRLA
jgi:lysophospholipase L1-like esterase